MPSAKHGFDGVYCPTPDATEEECIALQEELEAILEKSLPDGTLYPLKMLIEKSREEAYKQQHRPTREEVEIMLKEAEGALRKIYDVFGEGMCFLPKHEIIEHFGNAESHLDYVSERLIQKAYASEQTTMRNHINCIHSLIESSTTMLKATQKARSELTSKTWEEALIDPKNKSDVREETIHAFLGFYKYIFKEKVTAYHQGKFAHCIEALIKTIQYKNNHPTFAITYPNDPTEQTRILSDAIKSFKEIGSSEDYYRATWNMEELHRLIGGD